jgi:hypothetical protein
MKFIMSRFHELHNQDGVILWFCFLKRFARTTRENLIEAYSQLSESKLQLSNFNVNVLHLTNVIRIPVCCLLKAKENPSFQHFLYVFHGVMDAPNEEFRNFVINLYSDYRKGAPTTKLSMLELLELLDTEYNRINNLGHWIKKEDSQVLALNVTISNLQSQLSSLMSRYNSLHALVTQSSIPPPPTPGKEKLQKPPAKKPDDPEITTYNGFVWKWCDKCFNGCWNRTHVTSEHVAGIGKRNRRSQPPSNTGDKNTNDKTPLPQANLATVPPPTPSASEIPAPSTIQALVASDTIPGLDFL